MAPQSRISREMILAAATRMVGEGGLAAATFQALGAELGVSKQAIIYWFPTKADLARELALPFMVAEAVAVERALARIRSGRRAIEVFLRTLIEFHRADLGRFRLLYIAPQYDLQFWVDGDVRSILPAIHATTDRLYSALERTLLAAPDFTPKDHARRAAVAAHMAAIGLVCMLSLTNAAGDPMAHGDAALTDAMVALTTGRLVGGSA